MDSYENSEKWVDSCLASKDELFFQHGIQILPQRWEKIVASDGHYFQWHISNYFLKLKYYFSWKSSENLFQVQTRLNIIVSKHIKGFNLQLTAKVDHYFAYIMLTKPQFCFTETSRFKNVRAEQQNLIS